MEVTYSRKAMPIANIHLSNISPKLPPSLYQTYSDRSAQFSLIWVRRGPLTSHTEMVFSQRCNVSPFCYIFQELISERLFRERTYFVSKQNIMSCYCMINCRISELKELKRINSLNYKGKIFPLRALTISLVTKLEMHNSFQNDQLLKSQ